MQVDSILICFCRVLSTQLVAIFRKWPHLVMDQFSDLLDFVGGIRNITGRQDFFIHVASTGRGELCD